jgi:hypothetical protein
MQSLMPVIYMEPEWLEQVRPPDGEFCSRHSGPLRRPVANTPATAVSPKSRLSPGPPARSAPLLFAAGHPARLRRSALICAAQVGP